MKSKILLGVLVVLLLVIQVPDLHALLLLECRDDKYKLDNSKAVIDGKVESINIVREGMESYEIVTISAQKSLKGDIRGQVRLKHLSGVIVEDAAEFRVGESSRFYLVESGYGDGTYALFCLSQGKTLISASADVSSDIKVDVDDAVSISGTQTTSVKSYVEARQRYMDSKESYQEAKEDYIEAKNSYEREKNELRLRDVILKVKNFLLRSDEAMIDYMLSLKAKISENDDLPAQKKAEIITQIEADISWLEGRKTQINGANTRQEVISISRELKDRWQDIKPRERIYVGIFLSYKLTGILNRAEGLSDRIEDIIEELRGKGKDTKRLEELLASYNAKIQASQEARVKAIEAYSNVNVLDSQTRITQGRQYILESQTSLKAAHDELAQILKIVKDYRVEIKSEARAEGDLNVQV